MPSDERISLELSYWSDFVGTFDPWKVLWQVKKSFPSAVFDLTDHQEVRLNRDLEGWAHIPEPRRQTLVNQSKRLYRDNGPTYKFEIPCGQGAAIKGCARRYTVSFLLPLDVSPEIRQGIIAFLESLKLGPATLKVRTPQLPPDDK
jgi:hypothetical protein